MLQSMDAGLARAGIWSGARRAITRVAASASRDRMIALLGIAAALVHVAPLVLPSQMWSDAGGREDRGGLSRSAEPSAGLLAGETLIGGYVGVPYHLNSDARIVRPDKTDVTIKGIEWYGEPFKFPLYAGVRATRWSGPFGFMLDFLHDKAIARTGKGAHGSRVTGERAIPQIVEASGLVKGNPVAAKLTITEILERLEFTHGHNMLMPTALLRLGSPTPRFRPYVGLGAGVAIPHVEIFPAGEGDTARTNEYQLTGPALQAVAGLEIEMPYGPIIVEYKFTFAWLRTAMTGGKTPSWCNCDFVSDFARHIAAWWRGDEPRLGRLTTSLATHQVVAGAAYRLGSYVRAPR